MVKHIAFTMYPVKDMARARKFYEDGLGLQMTTDYQGKWIEYHLENGAFALTTMAEGVTPSAKAGGSIAFEVDDVDATMAKLAKSGGKITVPAFDTPGCRMGFAADSEGNGLCVHAKKPGRD